MDCECPCELNQEDQLPPESEPAEEEQHERYEHECTLGVYTTKDMSKQSNNYHYLTRLNQGFFKCAVYDSDHPTTARLLGVEYIISDRIFDVLPPQEQKLWHSHNYEVKENFWVNIKVVEVLHMTELQDLARSYGKFWWTWQWDSGDALPLGVPSATTRAPPETTGCEAEDSRGGRNRTRGAERFVTYIRRIKGGANNSSSNSSTP